MTIIHEKNEQKASPLFIQWGVIFAGVAVASAISIVLMQFSSLLGLSANAPLRGEGSIASWGVIATGIWLLWIQLLASLSGGYIAGAMRAPTPQLNTHENEMRDGIYGLTTWAVTTIGVFVVISLAFAIATYVEVNSASNIEVIAELTRAEKNAAVIFAFAAGATSLGCAVAAWWAAVMAGEHRDKKVDFSKQLSFKK